MNLLQYYNKKVSIETTSGRKINGVVTDYFYSEDNENEAESIAVKSSEGNYIELYESDIKSIEILD